MVVLFEVKSSNADLHSVHLLCYSHTLIKELIHNPDLRQTSIKLSWIMSEPHEILSFCHGHIIMICRYHHREVKVNKLEFAKEMIMKSEKTAAGQSL